MADYYGQQAIAERLGVNPRTVVRLWEKGFPAYLKRHPHPAKGQGHRMYYTNDNLIQVWELVRCRQSRKEILGKRAARLEKKLVALARKEAGSLISTGSSQGDGKEVLSGMPDCIYRSSG